MSPHVWSHLRRFAAERRAAGLRRSLSPREPASLASPVDLSSNDYLSLVKDPRVVEATVAAVRRWGSGATGSRLVTGSTTLHRDLEQALCDWVGAPATVVFSSGYTANLGVITALTDPDTLVISDAHNHASIIDACRLSRAETVVVPHQDPAAVADALANRRQSRALVVTESIFSVDGDAADLAALHEAVSAHGAALLVDEAHSLGVVGDGGRGSVAAAGLAKQENVVVTATLSKSLAAQGGAVLGSQDVIDHIIDTARPFIFDTALAPASAASALAALEVLMADSELPQHARRAASALHSAALETGWESPRPDAAVISLLIGDPEVAVAEQQRWHDAGLSVGVFRPPSVPDGRSRLRLTAHAGLSETELDRVRAVMAQSLIPSRTVDLARSAPSPEEQRTNSGRRSA